VKWVDRASPRALAGLVAYHAFRKLRPTFPVSPPPLWEDPGLVEVFWGAGVSFLAEPGEAVAALLAVAREGLDRGDALPAVSVCDALRCGLGPSAGGAPFIGYLRADAQLTLLAACRAAGAELRGRLVAAGAVGGWVGSALDALDAAVAEAGAFVDACHALGGVALAGTAPLLGAALAACGGAPPPPLPPFEPDAACDVGWLSAAPHQLPPPAGGSVWLSFSVAELAAAWAALDWEAFRCVPLHELFADHSGAATEDCYHHGADLFLRFTRQRANAVSLWVYAEVAACRGDARAAAALLERMLAVAGALRALHDYTGAFALGAGLDVVLPAKFGAAKALLSEAGAAEFAALAALVDSRNEHAGYRAAFLRRPRGAPVVPYLGAHNKEAMTLKEGIKDKNVQLARAMHTYWAQLTVLQERSFEECGAVPAGTSEGAAAAALRAASRPYDIQDEIERKGVETLLDEWASPLKKS